MRLDVINLGFGSLIPIQERMIEVIINEGVEFSSEMVSVYHQSLVKFGWDKFRLLINKKNSYTYSFQAQREIAALPNVLGSAVLIYSNHSRAAIESLVKIAIDIAHPIEVFDERELAINWLKTIDI